jgi:adenosylcobinamide-phosphate synthase
MVEYFIIPCAVILDFLLGDPYWMPHPVRIMGWCIATYEKCVRYINAPLFLSGIVLSIGFPLLVWTITDRYLHMIHQYNETLRWAIEIWIVYQCISIRSLIDETHKVYTHLTNRNIEQARSDLSMIVGRDTDRLPENEISRATVETIAEGTVDGVFSPLFYAFLGGAPLVLAFKVISTLDSMVGYKNRTYIDFGWASAKFDDVANWVPARLSIVIIPIAALFLGMNSIQAFIVGFRDRLKHTSPNAGHAEAAYAGALGVQLGGKNMYGGIVNSKPFLNAGMAQTTRKTIPGILVDSYRKFYCICFIFIFFSHLSMKKKALSNKIRFSVE